MTNQPCSRLMLFVAPFTAAILRAIAGFAADLFVRFAKRVEREVDRAFPEFGACRGARRIEVRRRAGHPGKRRCRKVKRVRSRGAKALR